MGLGHLGKQLAQQALSKGVKDVVDSLRPSDAAATAESLGGTKSAPAGENTGSTVVAQLQAMQGALKEDQELIAMYTNGISTVRVLEVYAPSWKVFVLTGIDTDRALTRVICSADALQLVCKVLPAAPGAKPARIRFVTPKS